MLENVADWAGVALNKLETTLIVTGIRNQLPKMENSQTDLANLETK